MSGCSSKAFIALSRYFCLSPILLPKESFYGDSIISDDGLVIPHSDYQNRDFVLNPLKEIAPYSVTSTEVERSNPYKKLMRFLHYTSFQSK